MAKFTVEVEYTYKYSKKITVFATGEKAAEKRIYDLISDFPHIEDVEIIKVNKDNAYRAT